MYIDRETGVRQVQLSRRKLPSGSWESLVFEDHKQTEDDGHNVICIGISHQDGTLHISWDLHSSQFNYRSSRVGLVSQPESADWSVQSFGPVRHDLPGLAEDLSEVSTDRRGIFRVAAHPCRPPTRDSSPYRLSWAGRCCLICERGSRVSGTSGCMCMIRENGRVLEFT